MEKKLFTEEEIKELLKMPGNIRGAALATDYKYIKIVRSKEDLKLLEKNFKKYSHYEYKKIKFFTWYPAGIRIMSLLLIKKLFNFTKEDTIKMGEEAVKYSFILKIFTKFFPNPTIGYKMSPKFFSKYFDFGKVVNPEIDLKKRYFISYLYNFKANQIIYYHIGGFMMGMGELAIKNSKNFTLEEENYIFKGKPCHRFIIRWEYK